MPLPELNDSVQAYYDFPSPLHRFGLRLINRLIRGLGTLRDAVIPHEILFNERVVEYTLVLRALRASGLVLDLGCSSSRFPVELASLGYRTVAVDRRPYPFRHPNLTFVHADLTSLPFRSQSFDAVTAVSTIEHVGIAAYGESAPVPDGDRTALEEAARVLRLGGQLLLTVPFGRERVTEKHRIYTYDALQQRRPPGLFSVSEQFFVREPGGWVPASHDQAALLDSPSLPCNAVAFLHWERRS